MQKDVRAILLVMGLCLALVFVVWYSRKDWECKFHHGPRLRDLEQRIEKLEKAHEKATNLPVR